MPLEVTYLLVSPSWSQGWAPVSPARYPLPYLAHDIHFNSVLTEKTAHLGKELSAQLQNRVTNSESEHIQFRDLCFLQHIYVIYIYTHKGFLCRCEGETCIHTAPKWQNKSRNNQASRSHKFSLGHWSAAALIRIVVGELRKEWTNVFSSSHPAGSGGILTWNNTNLLPSYAAASDVTMLC